MARLPLTLAIGEYDHAVDVTAGTSQARTRLHSLKQIAAIESRNPMAILFEQSMIEVWRQVLIENAEVVVLGTERYTVRLIPNRRFL
ncbi:MAG: hypothetical protein WCA19_17970 [Candidatus Acidiferrales bacterium]